MLLEKLLFLEYNMSQYYFTNAYPLANNQNINFTGLSSTNPYKLIQKAGKRKSKRKNKNKKRRTHKKKLF